MKVKVEQVLDALRGVKFPGASKNIVDSEQVSKLNIDGDNVFFTLTAPTKDYEVIEMVNKACESVIKQQISEKIEVHVTVAQSQFSLQYNAEKPSLTAGVKHVIAVASGKGGVGKSTVAANLAVTLARKGYSVGLVDADIYGPSMPIMFGISGEKPHLTKVDGKTLLLPVEKHGVKLMSMGILINPKQAVVWRGSMAVKALKQLFTDVLWENIDFMIVDLPPGTGDIQLSLAQDVDLSGAVIVTTPQSVAVSDVVKSVEMFNTKGVEVPVLGFIENMAYFIPEDAPEKKYYIFGKGGGEKLSEEYNLPLLGQVPIVEPVRVAGDEGRPIVLDEKSIVSSAFDEITTKLLEKIPNLQTNPVN